MSKSVRIPEEVKRIVDECYFLVELKGGGATRRPMMYWNLLRNKLNDYIPWIVIHRRTQCEAFE